MTLPLPGPAVPPPTPENVAAAVAVLNELVAAEQQPSTPAPTDAPAPTVAFEQVVAQHADALRQLAEPAAAAAADVTTPPATDVTTQAAPPVVDTPPAPTLAESLPPVLTPDESHALLTFADEIAAAQAKLAVALYNAGKPS